MYNLDKPPLSELAHSGDSTKPKTKSVSDILPEAKKMSSAESAIRAKGSTVIGKINLSIPVVSK